MLLYLMNVIYSISIISSPYTHAFFLFNDFLKEQYPIKIHTPKVTHPIELYFRGEKMAKVHSCVYVKEYLIVSMYACMYVCMCMLNNGSPKTT